MIDRIPPRVKGFILAVFGGICGYLAIWNTDNLIERAFLIAVCGYALLTSWSLYKRK